MQLSNVIFPMARFLLFSWVIILNKLYQLPTAEKLGAALIVPGESKDGIPLEECYI